MRKYKGKQLRTGEICKIVENTYPDINAEWAQPSDHCKDPNCIECCPCTKTNDVIFKRVRRGLYEVL
jgi:hypothetical protein